MTSPAVRRRPEPPGFDELALDLLECLAKDSEKQRRDVYETSERPVDRIRAFFHGADEAFFKERRNSYNNNLPPGVDQASIDSLFGEEAHRTFLLRYSTLMALRDATRRTLIRRLGLTDDDRESVVFDGFHAIVEHKALLNEYYGSEALRDHRRSFFFWFLRRYDLRRCRQVYGDNWLIRSAEHFLLAATIALSLIVTQGGDWSASLRGWAWAPLLVLYALLWLLLRASMVQDGMAAALSLVPRLAGSVAVGFVVFCSSSELMCYVLGWTTLQPGIAFLGGATLYLILELSRHLPTLRLSALWRRAASLLAVGSAHALALALAGQAIASAAVRDSGADLLPPDTFTLPQLFNVAMLILAVGILLNVIWEEKPLTEPL